MLSLTSGMVKLYEYSDSYMCMYLQAYRLEPLVNPLYANIKPVKVDSAGSKHSKDMVDLASGPRTQQQLVAQTKGWLDTFSQWVSKKSPSQTNTTDGGKPKPEKVWTCNFLLFVDLYQSLFIW